MRIALYLGAWFSGGHHPVFLDGVVDALLAEGAEVHVLSALRPTSDRVASWIEAPRIPPDWLAEGRTHFEAVVRWAHALEADRFIDLYFDWTMLRLLGGFDDLPPATFSLHQVAVLNTPGHPVWQLAPDAMRLLAGADPERLVVVHTEAAVGELARHGVRARRLLVPIRPLPRVRPRDPDDFFLFVGDGRPDKGLDLALAAAARSGSRLRVSGTLGAREVALLERAGYASVEHLGFLDDAQLCEEMSAAIAVVCPYPVFRVAAGSASTVALEAISCGCPVIAPSFMHEQLPPDPSGVLTYDAARGAEGLAAAMATAPDVAPSLRSAARACSDDVRLAHSFERYVAGLLDPGVDVAPTGS